MLRMIFHLAVDTRDSCRYLVPREPKSERPEPNDLVGAGAILFFLLEPEQEPGHFKKLEWSRSWHKLVRLQAPAVFENFVKK